MKKAIGRKLSFEEVQQLKDGTKIYIESKYPEEHVFLGTKEGNHITDEEGKIKWALAADFEALCIAYEWKSKGEMNNIERLFSNVKIFQAVGELDNCFETFISENENSDSISELNEFMETEMSCWD